MKTKPNAFIKSGICQIQKCAVYTVTAIKYYLYLRTLSRTLKQMSELLNAAFLDTVNETHLAKLKINVSG